MNRQAIPSQHRRVEVRELGCSRGAWAGLLRILGALALFINPVGCASLDVLTATERAGVSAGEKAIVLIRVKCTIDNEPYEPFSFSTVMDNVSFGLGTFDTMGEPRTVGHRFLSEESRRAGWTYFVLSPGVYYLAVRPPQRTDWRAYEKMLQAAPRWRIDIPEHAKLIYVGTLDLTGESDPLLLGGRIMRSIIAEEATIEREYELASRLLSEHFPDAGEAKTVQMQRWHRGDPIIIRSPLPGSSK